MTHKDFMVELVTSATAWISLQPVLVYVDQCCYCCIFERGTNPIIYSHDKAGVIGVLECLLS